MAKDCILSKRLKDLRNEHSKSQKEVMLDLDLKQTALSNYENGTREPSVEILNKFARYYNVTVDYLTGNSEYKNPQHEQFNQQLSALSKEAISGLSTLYSNRAIEVLDVLLRDNKFALLLEAFYAYYKGIHENKLLQLMGNIKGIYFSTDMDVFKRQYMHFALGHLSEIVLKYLDEVREVKESE